MQQTAEILTTLESLWQRTVQVRTSFPHYPDSAVGCSAFKPPGYYEAHGFSVTLQFSSPLTDNDVALLNVIGHWLNESCLIRLYALLREYNIVLEGASGPCSPKVAVKSQAVTIDQSLAGWEDVDLLRRLRNVILKEGGQYKPEKAAHRTLMEKLVARYHVPQPVDGFPLPINGVVEPMFNGCRDYVQAWLQKSGAALQAHTSTDRTTEEGV